MNTVYLVISVDSDFGDKLIGVFQDEENAHEAAFIFNKDKGKAPSVIIPLDIDRNYHNEEIMPYGL